MIDNPSIKKILFGGDYNPEQWDCDTWQEDMTLLPLAGVDTVTLNVFNWARIQPSDTEYDFSLLDKIIDMVSKKGINICLATATATHPAWMARRHPDVLRVDLDGRKRKFGARQNSCPNSPTYRKYSVLLAQKLALRYGTLKNILAWHISNEYGGLCYCDNCQKAFRQWLKEKYKSIEALNYSWNTSFWGHTYYDWEDVVSPSHISERWPVDRTSCQIQTIDYYRFQSDSLLECFNLEAQAIKEITPDIPVTTNLMGTYPELDYHKWGKYMDFVSWDNYPAPDDPYTRTAMNHALMRGCKPGKPFALMEQTPSVTNWQPYNALKRPGVMRLLSYQAVAHGADTVLFFQMRRSRGCCEKFHGAIIDHYPTAKTRVFKETAALGKELAELGSQMLGSLVPAKAAILFDWDCLWAVTFTAGPSVDLHYTDEVFKYYDAFARQNIPVDVVPCTADLAEYDVVVAPVLYMVKEGVANSIKNFVDKGGTFVTTTMSGMADANDLVTTKGYPGELRELCGVWVEETDALLPGKQNSIEIAEGSLSGSYPCSILCDVMHAESAQVMAVYGSDFYKGTPVVCRNKFGKGFAWYIGTCIPSWNNTFLKKLVLDICSIHGIFPLIEPQQNIEAVCRKSKDGKEFLFVLNHGEEQRTVKVPFGCKELISSRKIGADECVRLESKDVIILKKT